MFDLELGADLDAVLLAAGLDDCVHGSSGMGRRTGHRRGRPQADMGSPRDGPGAAAECRARSTERQSRLALHRVAKLEAVAVRLRRSREPDRSARAPRRPPPGARNRAWGRSGGPSGAARSMPVRAWTAVVARRPGERRAGAGWQAREQGRGPGRGTVPRARRASVAASTASRPVPGGPAHVHGIGRCRDERWQARLADPDVDRVDERVVDGEPRFDDRAQARARKPTDRQQEVDELGARRQPGRQRRGEDHALGGPTSRSSGGPPGRIGTSAARVVTRCGGGDLGEEQSPTSG